MIWIIGLGIASLLAYFILISASRPALKRDLLRIMRWGLVISGALWCGAFGLELMLVDEYRHDIRQVYFSIQIVWFLGGVFYWVGKSTRAARAETSRDATVSEPFPSNK